MLDDTQCSDGAVKSPLPNLLQRTHEVQGDQMLYRFGNGLLIKTEIFRKHDRLRILPLGAPQGSLMNHMLHFPDVGSCTCTLRINTPGSPTDRHKDKKVYKRGLSWHPSGPLTHGDALDAGRVDARRLLRPPPLAVSHHPACSPPCWLRPRRHAEE